MRLLIKNKRCAAENKQFEHKFDVTIENVELENLLNQIDIKFIIQYYGITELLDTIGSKNIKLYCDFWSIEDGK